MSFERWDSGNIALFPDGAGGYVNKSRTCPRKLLKEDGYAEWTWLYGFYKNGHLESRGGISQQPMRYLNAMKLIDNTLAMIEQSKHD